MQQVDGRGPATDRELCGGGPIDRDAERAGDVVGPPGREQRGGRERRQIEVRERVDGAVAADEHEPALGGARGDGRELGLAAGDVGAHARAGASQLVGRPRHVGGAAGVPVDDELDLAADDREGARSAASRRANLGAGNDAGVGGGDGAHGGVFDC